MEYKVGDKVVCVFRAVNLTVGNEYEIVSINEPWYRVVNDIGEEDGYKANRFKLSEANKPTLLEIINFIYPELDLKEGEPFIIKGVNNKFKIKNNEFWQLINGEWKEIKSKRINNIYKKGIEKIEKRYYLKAKDWRVVANYEAGSYLNLNKFTYNTYWQNKESLPNIQTIFTLKEIEELKKISDIAKARVEFCELVEFVEVENEN